MALIDDYNKALRELEQGLNVQEMMKKANAIIRNSRLSDGDKVKELTDIGFSEKQALQIIAPDYMGRKGFPQYKLTSNNDRNKRLQDKVNSLRRQLDSQKQAEESGTTGEEFTFDGGTATANHDLDRYQIFFDEIPTSEMRTKLKGAGWNWSPSNKAWQRKITDNALWSMKNVLPGFSNTGGSEKTMDHTAEDLNISKIDMRDFSFVTFGAYQLGKYFKEQGLIDTHLPSIRFVVLDGSKVTASQKVKDYLHKMIPQAPVDKIDFSIYPKTYIAEAKDLFKKGMVIGDERLDQLIQSTYKELIVSKEDFRSKMNEAIDDKLSAIEHTHKVGDLVKGIEDNKVYKVSSVLSDGRIEVQVPGQTWISFLDEPTNYIAYEENELPIKKAIVKIDGKEYDLTDLELPEDHPIMILDRNSPQWKAAVKEYFEEKEKPKAQENSIQWHEYKGQEYFYEPIMGEWFWNDMEFDSEEAIKKAIDDVDIAVESGKHNEGSAALNIPEYSTYLDKRGFTKTTEKSEAQIIEETDKYYILKTWVPYDYKYSTIVYFVSGKDASEYGQFPTIEEARAKFNELTNVNGSNQKTEETTKTNLDPSSYKNPFELNKAIEKWIDENVFTLFSDREGFLNNLNRVDHREYTIEEKIFLKSFSGYGGLGKFGQVEHKSNFEFYTPKLLIEKMWALAYKHGFTSQGSVLEPAVGTGEFLQFATSSPEVHAYEINEYSAIITAILYPFARVKLMPFEKLFIEKNYTVKNKLEGLKKYDLVIGNPPYASFDRNISRYLTMGEKDYTGAKNYVDYFIRRGIDLVKPGGLLIYVIGAEVRMGGRLWLDEGDSPVKQYINSVADLVEAYRLPNEVFERTGVTSDIIVLKKR